MIETVFESDDLPPEDRFDGWQDYKSRLLAPVAVSSSHAPDFRARLRTMHLGETTVSQGVLHPATLRRTPKLIRLSDPETYQLTLVLHGTAGFSGSDENSTFRRYDIIPRSSSRPHTIWTDDSQACFAKLGITVPASLLSVPREKADLIIGRPLSARTGTGALLAGFLTRLAREAGTFQASDGPRLGAVAAGLVSSLFACALELDRALPAETQRRVLTMRIRAFIEQHLCDPELSPATIAAAHHISVSHLHRLFDLDGQSVMAWIRRQRLERARQDLTDRSLCELPVHVIAARWGYSRHSVFTRAYRAAYGISPSDQRHEAATRTGRRRE